MCPTGWALPNIYAWVFLVQIDTDVMVMCVCALSNKANPTKYQYISIYLQIYMSLFSLGNEHLFKFNQDLFVFVALFWPILLKKKGKTSHSSLYFVKILYFLLKLYHISA